MNKACPVVIRQNNGCLEILAFVHPSAGRQVVKGTIEPGEPLAAACCRELYEEAGIRANAETYLGSWASGYEEQVWGFYLMHHDGELPDQWLHFTNDDGGHMFRFYWHPIDAPLDGEWHSLFKGAVGFIAQALGNTLR